MNHGVFTKQEYNKRAISAGRHVPLFLIKYSRENILLSVSKEKVSSCFHWQLSPSLKCPQQSSNEKLLDVQPWRCFLTYANKQANESKNKTNKKQTKRQQTNKKKQRPQMDPQGLSRTQLSSAPDCFQIIK